MPAARLLDAIAPPRMGRRFRWALSSSWVSNLGDGFALAAGPLLVASRTSDPRLVALATLLQRLPWLVFALPAGVVADRHDRVKVVVASDLCRSAVLVGLTACMLTGRAGVAVVLVALALLGTAEVFGNTAFGTILPSIVGRDDLALANARMQTGFITVSQLVGPPVGAALFALSHPSPFIGQAALVAAGVALISRVGPRARVAGEVDAREAAGSFTAEVTEGVRWVAHHPAVRTLTLTILFFNVTFGAAWSVLVLWSAQRLHAGPVGYGLLTTAGAAGGVAATLGYGALTRRVSLGNLMRAGLVIETLTHLAFALITSLPLALATMVAFGGHAFVWGTTETTVRQRAVPEDMQGRATGVNRLGSFAGLSVGAAAGGPIASAYGITGPFWFAFVGSALLLVGLWGQMRHIAHAEVDF